ncbi:hypothetical protein HUT19_37615 [Streptomyces sp. NA02950]|uniref:hypothetical protein n=1 Tax=Streptomyces sp. NA02950 TaxID=2742137 RepID=UPI0015907387|nr:hypothetical protein [Streptomyces sp. NA02950]QKV96713.1 hypothetical protein HUT19_37615 [Streptomyces sp. NA02950]
MADEVHEIRPAAFEGGFRTLEIDGESWLLLGDVCRAVGIKRHHAITNADASGIRTVDVAFPGGRNPIRSYVISESAAMGLAASKNKRCEVCNGTH